MMECVDEDIAPAEDYYKVSTSSNIRISTDINPLLCANSMPSAWVSGYAEVQPKGDKMYVIYVVEIQWGGFKWKSFQRYSKCNNCHKAVCSVLKKCTRILLTPTNGYISHFKCVS